jgi:hypothetical protein
MSYQYDVKRMEEEEGIFVICEILKFVYSNIRLKCLTLKRNWINTVVTVYMPSLSPMCI